MPLRIQCVLTLYRNPLLSYLQYVSIPCTLYLPIVQEYLHFVMSKLLCDPPEEEDQHIFGEGKREDSVLPGSGS